MTKIFIIVAEEKRRARDFADALSREKDLEIVASPEEADLLLVLGGDGCMTKSIHKYYKYGKPFFGINFGNKGYLLNDLKPDILEIVKSGAIQFYNFPLFSFEGEDIRGKKFSGVFAGDFYFNRVTERSGQSCRLKVKVGGKTITDDLTSDGFIVASSIGSTAYLVNEGGPAIHPLLPVMGLGAIGNRKFIPIVISNSEEITVEALEPKKRRVVGCNSGQRTFPNMLWVKIKKTEHSFNLGFRRSHDLTKTLVKKVLKA